MNKDSIYKELRFNAVRSSGAGGQHVNKVSSKVELYFDLASSEAFTEKDKKVLLNNLSNRITKDGVLKISSSESRSQHTNKEKVIKRLIKMIEKGLIVPKKRKAIKISSAQKIKRLDSKTKQAVKKLLRKKPNLE